MTLTIVSNYINHHQIPVANELYKALGNDFCFIQTEPMEEDRVKMGWGSEISRIPYLKLYYEKAEECASLIMDSDIVVFGGVEDESYIKPRLDAKKIVIRYSERLYKEGQWKSVSPRGRKKKYEDHTQYANDRVYLLCSGGYVASDFNIVDAYPNKKFTWGYFPEIHTQDLNTLKFRKTHVDNDGQPCAHLLWAGRFLRWKHPEYAVKIAKDLKKANIPFHLDMIGGGELEDSLKKYVKKHGLDKEVTFHGFQDPRSVRNSMEDANIYLFTSDYYEGWGAVLNESMNSACAVVCGHGIGAAPYLVEHDENGLVYKNKSYNEFKKQVLSLASNPEKVWELGQKAYENVITTWNPVVAANRLLEFANGLLQDKIIVHGEGPLSYAPDISPRAGYEYIKRKPHSGNRIYVCHTFYHVYVSMLKEFALPANEQGKAEIALSTMSSDFSELKPRLEKTGVFSKVHVLDEKRDTDFPKLMKYKENHNNILIHTFNRIIYTKKYAKIEQPYMKNIDFKSYDHIFVYCDSDPIGYYLNAKHIPYHAVEDGLNCLVNLDDAHVANAGHFELKAKLAAMNLIFIQNGFSKYCIDMEINDLTVLELGCPKYKIVPRAELEARLTTKDKRKMVAAFVPDGEELMNKLSQIKDEKAVLLLTEPFHFDDETQIRIVTDIISEYCQGKKVVIKPHPRDLIDYTKYFKDCIVIHGKFPMEVMNFMDVVTFEKAISIVNEAMYMLNFVDEKIKLGAGYWDRYEDPSLHDFNNKLKK